MTKLRIRSLIASLVIGAIFVILIAIFFNLSFYRQKMMQNEILFCVFGALMSPLILALSDLFED